MDPRLIRYYKKQMYGGRSLVARTLDYVILRIMVLFVLFLVLLYFSRSFTVSVLISVFVTLAVSLILVLVRRNRIKKYIEKDTVRIKQKCLLEELTLMNEHAFADYISCLFDGVSDITQTNEGFTASKEGTTYCVFHNHPSTVCGVDSLLQVCRQYRDTPTVIVSLSDFNEAARTFCAGQDIKLVSGKKILQAAASKGMLPDEEAAQDKARKEMSETIITLDKLKSSAFSKTKVKAYIFCGLVVMCWPLVMGFRIYYPIIAVVCFVMAAITFRKNKSHEESHGIGIS